jgi:hypothetical protein
MFINYAGKELAFRFRHNANPESDIPLGTEVTVTDKEGNFVAKSFAKLHPNDQFNREIGRKVAFGRVLQEFVQKEERLPFWEAYSTWRTDEPRMTLGTKKERKQKLKVV